MKCRRLHEKSSIGTVTDGLIVIDETCKCRHSRRRHELGKGECDCTLCDCAMFSLGAQVTRTATQAEQQ